MNALRREQNARRERRTALLLCAVEMQPWPPDVDVPSGALLTFRERPGPRCIVSLVAGFDGIELAARHMAEQQALIEWPVMR